jgi:hypothetical protein
MRRRVMHVNGKAALKNARLLVAEDQSKPSGGCGLSPVAFR